MIVLLPHPLGPTIAALFPAGTRKETSSRINFADVYPTLTEEEGQEEDETDRQNLSAGSSKGTTKSLPNLTFLNSTSPTSADPCGGVR